MTESNVSRRAKIFTPAAAATFVVGNCFGFSS